MKILVILLIATGLLLNGCSSQHEDHERSAQDTSQAAPEYYTCPMHPSVRSDRPGACPVCGMALVKKTELKEASDGELADLKRVSLSPTQRVIANVTSEPVSVRPLAKEIVTSGIVDFAEPLRANVSARFRGRLEKLHVSFVGELVQKGDPLFDLYSPDLVSAQQDYLLAYSSSALPSQDPTLQSGTRQLLEASRSRLKIHFGMTDDQIARLESRGTVSSAVTFYAPMSGTVITKSILEGQYVDEGTTLYEVADLRRVWVYFDLYEHNLATIALGTKITFTTDAYPGEQFTGTVTFIDPVVNPDTRTVRVRTEAANPGNKLKPRMFVTGRIRVQLSPRLVVPSSAVLSLGTNDVVWIEVEEHSFEPRRVITGARSDGYVQILDGLREGERIVVTGGYLIDSESALRAPSSADPHQGHGTEQRTLDSSPKTESLSHNSASQAIRIHVKGTYHPHEIRVPRGKPVTLEFYRDEESPCTEEVVFNAFNIRKRLPAYETTTVTLTPSKAGTYEFTCGMEMVHGTLIVE